MRSRLGMLRKNSYGMLMCRRCHDGGFDLKNHPQNGPFLNIVDPEALRNPRPEVPATPVSAVWNYQQTRPYVIYTSVTVSTSTVVSVPPITTFYILDELGGIIFTENGTDALEQES
jgi:hypothetical protein